MLKCLLGVSVDRDFALRGGGLLQDRVGGPDQEVNVEVKFEFGGRLVFHANRQGHEFVEVLEEDIALPTIEGLRVTANQYLEQLFFEVVLLPRLGRVVLVLESGQRLHEVALDEVLVNEVVQGLLGEVFLFGLSSLSLEGGYPLPVDCRQLQLSIWVALQPLGTPVPSVFLGGRVLTHVINEL